MPRRKYATPPLCAPYEGHDPRYCDACNWIEYGIEIAERRDERRNNQLKQLLQLIEDALGPCDKLVPYKERQ